MRADNDLFQKNTMSFGEHLEELRVVLWRALMAVLIGCVVAAPFSHYVLIWLQSPLVEAIENSRFRRAISKADPNASWDPATVDRYRDQKLVPRELHVEKAAWIRLRNDESTDDFRTATPKELTVIRVWEPLDVQVIGLHIMDSFLTWLKATVAVGLFISSPVALWQLWTFVAAGLYQNERRAVYRLVPFSLALFLTGGAVAFFGVFPPVLDFLLLYNESMQIQLEPRIGDWLNFVLFLPFCFGIAFQLPLVMYALFQVRIVTIQTYLSKWRVAILCIFVAAMLLTPQEPISMLALALPMVVLYFLGILLCWWNRQKVVPAEEAVS